MGEKQRARLRKRAAPVIDKIVERCRAQPFAYFTEDDIRQEIHVICLSAIEHYCPSKGPLENYLQRCVTNRLKNLRRDKYFRPPRNNLDVNGETRDRINLVNALPLGGGDVPENGEATCSSYGRTSPDERAERNEQIALLEAELPENLLADFQRIRAGESLPAGRVQRVIAAARRIVHGQ